MQSKHIQELKTCMKYAGGLFYNQVSIKIEYNAFKKWVVWRYSIAKSKGDVLKKLSAR